MRILIIGAGNAGCNLAAKLCAEKHDVVIVDKQENALKEIQSQLDIQTIEGDGSSPRILTEAGIFLAHLLFIRT